MAQPDARCALGGGRVGGECQKKKEVDSRELEETIISLTAFEPEQGTFGEGSLA